ncbi:MAG: serine hydrolase domain-containing protein [Pseudomonadota bacterium]
MAHYGVPGVAVAIIKNGNVIHAAGYGVTNIETGATVTEDTVFSVGSVSKMGAAAASLRLVSRNKLSLDDSVNEQLKSWKIRNTDVADARNVTLRSLLSHTSGLSVHGFDDFLPGEPLPTVYETLDGTAPKSGGEAVDLLFVPGTSSKYSGGGTTVIQLLVSDVTGKSFAEAAEELVFKPLEMSRSTYANPLPEDYGNIAYAHGSDGELVAKPRGYHTFPEAAASGLWTSASDLARLIIAFQKSHAETNNNFLPNALARDVMTEVGWSDFGLGPMLIGTGTERRFFHSGFNDSYKAWWEGHLFSGNGLVVLTNGMRGFELIVEIRRAIADQMHWPFYREISVPGRQLGDVFSNRFVGTFKLGSQQDLAVFSQRLRTVKAIEAITIESEENGLQMFLTDNPTKAWNLLPLTDTHFLVEGMYLAKTDAHTIEFIRDNSGAVNRVILARNGYQVEMLRQFDPKPGDMSTPE